MFYVVEMTDTVKIEPWLFNVNRADAISVALNKKLANKVVYNVGLCVCLFDILELKDSYIFPGDGAYHTKVYFRYIVFRPIIDEVVVGKIKSCSEEGVCVTLGYFDDINIPPENLQPGSKFNEDEQVWVWEYATEDDTHELFMDINEDIRFKVVEETFFDTTPSSAPSGEPRAESSNEETKTKTPYSIKGSITDSGLGLLSWWANG